MELKQYDIVLVNLDPTVGSEIKKTRPCVVLSPDELNNHLQTLILAPMTTSSKKYPTRVMTRKQRKTGWVVLDQIRTVDQKRIIRVLDRLTEEEIRQTKSVIREMLVE